MTRDQTITTERGTDMTSHGCPFTKDDCQLECALAISATGGGWSCSIAMIAETSANISDRDQFAVLAQTVGETRDDD